jgi:hypothetical protein
MGLRDKLVLLALAAAIAAPAQVLDRIAVVVGKDVITETEVMQEARLEAFLNQTTPDLGPEARKAAADRLVNQQLVRNEMTVGAYPDPTDAEVEGALRSFRQEHFSSIPQYRASLQKYGITEDQLKKHLRWQLAAMRFTDMRFSPAVPGDQSADRAIATSAGQRGANRAAGGAVTPASGTTDEHFEQWLKQARSSTKIQFKPGAFQ